MADARGRDGLLRARAALARLFALDDGTLRRLLPLYDIHGKQKMGSSEYIFTRAGLLSYNNRGRIFRRVRRKPPARVAGVGLQQSPLQSARADMLVVLAFVVRTEPYFVPRDILGTRKRLICAT